MPENQGSLTLILTETQLTNFVIPLRVFVPALHMFWISTKVRFGYELNLSDTSSSEWAMKDDGCFTPREGSGSSPVVLRGAGYLNDSVSAKIRESILYRPLISKAQWSRSFLAASFVNECPLQLSKEALSYSRFSLAGLKSVGCRQKSSIHDLLETRSKMSLKVNSRLFMPNLKKLYHNFAHVK
jgi:hypothetical protein